MRVSWTTVSLARFGSGVEAETVAVLLNVKFAPWTMLGFDRLLVTPYVLVATLLGYLVAYWFLIPAVWWRDPERLVDRWLRRWLGGVVGVAVVFWWLRRRGFRYSHHRSRSANHWR